MKINAGIECYIREDEVKRITIEHLEKKFGFCDAFVRNGYVTCLDRNSSYEEIRPATELDKAVDMVLKELKGVYRTTSQ